MTGRGCNDRSSYKQRKDHGAPLAIKQKMHNHLSKVPRLGDIVFNLPKGGDNHKARQVTQTLRVVSITFTAIQAKEERSPKGEKPVEWILLTNLAVETLEQAQEKLVWYLCR